MKTFKTTVHPYQSLVLVLVGITLILGNVGCTPAQTAEPPQDLEAQVLEIIQNNPQAIIDSVQAYQQQQQQEQQAASQKRLQQLSQDPASIIGDSPTLGSPDRKIVLVEFSDFQCPFCSLAHETLKTFMDSYGQDVTLVYKHLPLQMHPQAIPAAEASWAAAQQGKFWEFHDALFKNQKQLGDAFYVKTATDLGLDIDQFNQDRASEAAKAAVEADVTLAQQLGISGTPYFTMNGIVLQGAQPLEKFVEALTKAKAELG